MQTAPLKMVGSNNFGRYPKISVEQTYNMIVSDDWLVDYAGYKKVATIGGTGRGLFSSTRLGKMIAVIDNVVYAIGTNLVPSPIGNLNTYSGDAFIDEDVQNHVGICDKQTIWIYDYAANTFKEAYTTTPPAPGVGSDLDFIPNYIAFHDGRFIATGKSKSSNSTYWRLSDPSNQNTKFPNASAYVGLFQTKPDSPVAVFRFPGKGNLIFVMGRSVTEPWYDLGLRLFPYQKNTSYNLDYGCLNPATIAFNDNIVVWLAANEKSGPFIAYTMGGEIVPISNDGIDFKLSELQHPENSYGFLFKQDGHLFYQITFPQDNLTYTYDFNTKRFYTLCDPMMNYHIAKRCVFFNNTYYFLSFQDGNLYELSTKYTDADGEEIPRIRIPPTFRLPDSSPFIVNNISFPIEQGNPQNNPEGNIPRADLSISNNGGESFGSSVGMNLNPVGKRKNRFIYWNLGYSNEITPQLRFWGKGRFVVGNGTMDYYQ